MAKELLVGNEVFEYPDNGANADETYGEQMSAWAEAVTEVLATLSGPNDIPLTTYSLADNQSIPQIIPLLKFSTSKVIKIKVEFIITRVIGATTLVESGIINGNFDGTDFGIATVLEGKESSGITLSMDNSGQFFYASTDLSHTSCSIKFKASTISND